MPTNFNIPDPSVTYRSPGYCVPHNDDTGLFAPGIMMCSDTPIPMGQPIRDNMWCTNKIPGMKGGVEICTDSKEATAVLGNVRTSALRMSLEKMANHGDVVRNHTPSVDTNTSGLAANSGVEVTWNYKGEERQAVLGHGSHDLTKLDGGINDRIAKIRVAGDCTAVAYEHWNKRGGKGELSGDAVYIGGDTYGDGQFKTGSVSSLDVVCQHPPRRLR